MRRLQILVRNILAALICLSPLLLPAAPGPLSIDDAFKASSFFQLRLSPNGRSLAALAYTGKATVVMMVDIDNLQSRIIYGPFTGGSAPLNVLWLGNDRLALDTYGGVQIIDLAGKPGRRFEGHLWRLVAPDSQGHERFLTVGLGQSKYIHRADSRTGETTIMNWDMPGEPTSWIMDRDGVPLVVTTIDTTFWTEKTTITHWYRPSLESKWEVLLTASHLNLPWQPIGIGRDRQWLAVRSSLGRDTQAIFRYSLAERRITDMMAGHPTEDIANVSSEDDEDGFIRVETIGMQPEIHWFDARWAALQKSIDLVLPDRINRLSGNKDGRVLVASTSDVDPGHWYVLDTKTMTLKEIVSRRPDLDPATMLKKKIVHYTANDGLSIPAYLTLPRDVKGPVPAVVFVHGGPWVRDFWNWDPEVQMLASRGYAVLQPQFRGSTGFGRKFTEAGNEQWGLAMQDDITAGANWLLAQGISDAGHMCIYGASYGGYAAMWAMAKTPTLFRCGISFAGVSDLNFMYRDGSDVNDSAAGRDQRRLLIGDPEKNRQKFDDVSPVKKAALFQGPVFIAHGSRDQRVPIEHSEKLVAALKANHKQVEWMELADEGHGIYYPEHRQRFYNALFDFLAKHIGPTPPAAPVAADASNNDKQ